MTEPIRPVILVADDDPSILKLVRLQLVEEGFRPVTAETGEEAIQRAIDERPDLVVLDLMLPDISGFEVLNRLRERGPVPVIVLTGKTRDSDKIRGLEMGADDYIPKPFNPEELAARIRAVLRRSRQTAAGALPASRSESRLTERSSTMWKKKNPLHNRNSVRMM